ncbi:ribonuclease M5 [Erysipelotrichaceae bacterium]|nr:ribonuclease M5 [Erysipelotrichaceae bacterium]
MKKKIGQLVVVEGKSDTRKLQQFYQVDTFETSGMGLTEDMLAQLIEISKKRAILVLTDPDMPGETIRRRIMEAIPEVEHIILEKKDSISKNGRKMGVEHASMETLDDAFSKIKKIDITQKSDITHRDLIDYGFIGRMDSRIRRDAISTKLMLGRVNAKQFLKRLQAFAITKKQVEEAIKGIK